MKKRLAIALAVIVGVLAIAAPIAASIYWAERQNLEQQLATVQSLADEVGRRTDEAQDQITEALAAMRKSGTADPCSAASIRLMRSLSVKLDYLKAVGYVNGEDMVCSSFGRHDEGRAGIPLGPVTYENNVGNLVRASVELALVPGVTYIASTDKQTGYTALVRRGESLQVFSDRPEISVGLFSTVGKLAVASRGEFDIAWLARLGESPSVQFESGGRLVALKRSPKYAVAAYAALEPGSVASGLRRTVWVMAPIGLAAGLILAFTVYFMVRRYTSMRALIKAGLRHGEFFLEYQPIIELHGGRCVGAEALIRWRRSDGRLIRPDLFIPVAEESGLIHEVTKRVLEIVSQETSELLKSRPELHIGVNLSSRDLVSPDTAHLVHETIRAMGVQPHNLLVEATERGFMQADVARRIMDDIHALNVQIAIDDFGTGYSSLSYLEKFELDYLKIDKSFVDTMGGEVATSQVAPHIIEMSKSLNLQMIAEGVETEAQVRYLQARGVQYAQGWFYAKAMPFAEFAKYVAGNDKLAA